MHYKECELLIYLFCCLFLLLFFFVKKNADVNHRLNEICMLMLLLILPVNKCFFFSFVHSAECEYFLSISFSQVNRFKISIVCTFLRLHLCFFPSNSLHCNSYAGLCMKYQKKKYKKSFTRESKKNTKAFGKNFAFSVLSHKQKTNCCYIPKKIVFRMNEKQKE